jgi:hypothetical protein
VLAVHGRRTHRFTTNVCTNPSAHASSHSVTDHVSDYSVSNVESFRIAVGSPITHTNDPANPSAVSLITVSQQCIVCCNRWLG